MAVFRRIKFRDTNLLNSLYLNSISTFAFCAFFKSRRINWTIFTIWVTASVSSVAFSIFGKNWIGAYCAYLEISINFQTIGERDFLTKSCLVQIIPRITELTNSISLISLTMVHRSSWFYTPSLIIKKRFIANFTDRIFTSSAELIIFSSTGLIEIN